MRRDTFKLVVLAAVIGFAVLYGMELSSKGIQNVNGSWEQDESVNPNQQVIQNTEGADPNSVEPSPAEEDDWTLPVQSRHSVDTPESNLIPRNDREPIVDRVSGKTAEVLHDLSRNGIRMVVSIFDNVLG